MAKYTPVLFVMFSVVLVAVSVLSVASYYGEADWTWIANQVVGFIMVLLVFSVAMYVLAEWLR